MRSYEDAQKTIALFENNPGEYIKQMLRDDRFLLIQVDMYRDTVVILDRVAETIQEIKKDMKKYGLLKQFDRSPHLHNFERYFAVWDLVQAQKPGWTYDIIVQNLNVWGLYKDYNIKDKKELKKATNLARQDYRTACKILKVAQKVKFRRKIARPTIALKNGKVPAQEAQEWETKLAKEGLGLNEVLYKGQVHVQYSDGPTKKKLSNEPKNDIWKLGTDEE